MAKTEIIGSWFNSGYHGHFRSKSRNDFVCEYRHLAKPTPPQTFVHKLKQPAGKHVFSKHDNRQSFLNDALIFQEGLGKRRIPNKTLGWKPELLHWMPQIKDPEKSGPHFSQYKVNYRGAPRQVPLKQQIIQRPKTSFDEDQPVTTTYRYSHGNDNPNKATLNVMSNLGLSRTLNKRQTTQGEGRDSVATCLTWYQPKSTHTSTKQTTLSPPAMVTQTAQHVPKPPSDPKPCNENNSNNQTASVTCTNGGPPAQPKIAFAE